MANKHMKRNWKPLVIREMKSKAIIIDYFKSTIPWLLGNIQKTDNTWCRWGRGTPGTLTDYCQDSEITFGKCLALSYSYYFWKPSDFFNELQLASSTVHFIFFPPVLQLFRQSNTFFWVLSIVIFEQDYIKLSFLLFCLSQGNIRESSTTQGELKS